MDDNKNRIKFMNTQLPDDYDTYRQREFPEWSEKMLKALISETREGKVNWHIEDGIWKGRQLADRKLTGLAQWDYDWAIRDGEAHFESLDLETGKPAGPRKVLTTTEQAIGDLLEVIILEGHNHEVQ